MTSKNVLSLGSSENKRMNTERKGELRAKFHPNFFFIYRFVYAYYNVVQNFIIFGKGFRKLCPF